MANIQRRNNQLPDQVNDTIVQLAKREGISPEGITILGGKPYINVTGLDGKIKNKCQKEGLILKSTSVEEIPGKEEDNLYGFRATIQFFDRENFQKSLKSITNITPEIITQLENLYTCTFSDVGWASPDTCEGIAYQYKYDPDKEKKVKGKLLTENVIMMASRRATNRAKREATGTGLTSVEEAIVEPNGHTGKPEVSTPQSKLGSSDPDTKKKLGDLLMEMADNDKKKAGELLKQYSSFDADGTTKFVTSLKDLKGKWLASTYGKAKKAYEENKSKSEVDVSDIPNWDEDGTTI